MCQVTGGSGATAPAVAAALGATSSSTAMNVGVCLHVLQEGSDGTCWQFWPLDWCWCVEVLRIVADDLLSQVACAYKCQPSIKCSFCQLLRRHREETEPCCRMQLHSCLQHPVLLAWWWAHLQRFALLAWHTQAATACVCAGNCIACRRMPCLSANAGDVR